MVVMGDTAIEDFDELQVSAVRNKVERPSLLNEVCLMHGKGIGEGGNRDKVRGQIQGVNAVKFDYTVVVCCFFVRLSVCFFG